jgi:hypothetical protein
VPSVQDARLLTALKEVGRILRDAGVEFAVGGGMATWARGGPPTEHDIDFVIRERDTEHAVAACAAAGLRTDFPPEGWLAKTWHEDVLVDLIFRPTGIAITDAFFARCESLNVAAVDMLVMPADDIMVTKLFALTEHALDYGPVLEYARSLREQIHWDELRRRTEASPFAHAFFALVDALHITEPVASRPAGAAEANAAARESAVRDSRR